MDTPVIEQRQTQRAPSALKVKPNELIFFTAQISIMLDSGVVLSDALSAIADQSRNEVLKEMVTDVADQIKSGGTLSDALANYPKIFNPMFISMVKAAEVSGEMSKMFEVLSEYLISDADTRKQVKGAMMYPVIMMLVAVAATGSLMFFVLPKFAKIYDAKGAALPAITRMLLNFSAVTTDIDNLTVIATIGMVIGFTLYSWKQTVGGQKTFDWLKIHTPVFGTMFIDTILTRSMRIMATMVNTGVSLLDALDIIQVSCDNYYFRDLWAGANAKIKDGYQLSESISLAPNGDLVDPGIIQMLRAGESSGRIAQVCDKISVFYGKKLANSIKMSTALIEPVMIIIMGIVVGTIAVAMLLPIFKISSVMAH